MVSHLALYTLPPLPSTMHHRWRQLPRILVLHTAAGWVFGAITAADSGSAFGQALLSATALQGSMTALLIGLLWGWTFLLLGQRWYLGGLLAIPGALAALPLHFTLWPVTSWEMSTWKAAGIVLTSYWTFLLPIALVMGPLAAWWAALPLPPRPLLREDEAEG